MTPNARRSRVVAAAAADSATVLSTNGTPVPATSWSTTHPDSKPRSSAWRAAATTSGSGSSHAVIDGRNTPIDGAEGDGAVDIGVSFVGSVPSCNRPHLRARWVPMEDGTSAIPGHTEGTGTCGTWTGATKVEETQSCEIRDLLDRLGDKWSLLVVELLGGGTQRFTQLRREIDGISQRMLTLTLRRLERDGLLRRTVHPVVPPQVDYELTPLGATLLDAIQPLVTWARAHRDEIGAARHGYDSRHPA
jgi:DNA-binding HxlR family transcriptional regulator